MALSGVETIDLQNIGIIKGHIDDESLSVLRAEVMAIKENFSSGIPHNKELAGHIRKEFLLSKSCNSIEPIVIELAARYNEKYNYRDPSTNMPSGEPYKLQLESLWVNFQQRYEFNPLHRHSGLYSFVIWLEIPYFLNFEHSVSPGKQAIDNRTGMFEFTYTDILGGIRGECIAVDRSYEGDIVLFPAGLHHMVHPFYSTDKYRISVAGNVTVVKND
jgi:hypothetical protein